MDWARSRSALVAKHQSMGLSVVVSGAGLLPAPGFGLDVARLISQRNIRRVIPKYKTPF